MTETLVETTALGMTYESADGRASVLTDITCRIEAGDMIALIGPSGSGKSTLLHILAGLIQPTSGQVGWPALGARDDLMPEHVQVAFQSPSLFAALNVQDNIALPLLLAGNEGTAGVQAERLLQTFGLADLARKLPEELSGGQSQRIAMLRALAPTPRLIFADEPTGQLDSATAQAFLTEVIGICTALGTALVIATHDPNVAARMAHHWTIDHGTLWQSTNRAGSTA